ncbi:hypothetical protein BV898_01603 [Hypsibius exemplaris]|uniref:Bulb-type lectin domain-containing protein n=1 Tax=Hypsibius exemplaris TaxID=2072580 RepID=A0A1W0XAM4_HYPEX|nr:hypothetical protein BV898_01603 [Hypsibius exemplaris]
MVKSHGIVDLAMLVLLGTAASVYGGCFQSPWRLCGSIISRFCDASKDQHGGGRPAIRDNALYNCEHGEDPVLIRKCALGWESSSSGVKANDYCRRGPPTLLTSSPPGGTSAGTSAGPIRESVSVHNSELGRESSNQPDPLVRQADRQYKLVMQADGDAVLRRTCDDRVIWTSATRFLSDHPKALTIDVNG